MARILRYLTLAALLATAVPAQAAPSPFDLAGPRLNVAVTRNGSTLPLEWVPNLAEGDRISVKLDLTAGHRDRFRMVAAFLRGAVDRPASITPADPGPALGPCTAILEALGYEGTCCFNYKWEEGALRFLELNPRFGGSLVGVVTEYVAAHLAAL